MKRPIESDYTSQVAYTRALEAYCDTLAQPEQSQIEETLRYEIDALQAKLAEYRAQPEPAPVAWANPNDLQEFDMKVRTNGGPLHTVPLYTTPPQRKPLTDEEIYSLADRLEIWNEDDEEWILDPNTFARAIEAAHGIKE